MANKMLIDASHEEETRVVVVRGSRIEEFDFESEHKKQLKGNIYLAKVTRVEPSLQAAFVEYGGNRHGFLAFSEIHPDYYQIPKADRQALLEELARAHEEEEEAEEELARPDRTRRSTSKAARRDDDSVSEDADTDEDASNDGIDAHEAEADDSSAEGDPLGDAPSSDTAPSNALAMEAVALDDEASRPSETAGEEGLNDRSSFDETRREVRTGDLDAERRDVSFSDETGSDETGDAAGETSTSEDVETLNEGAQQDDEPADEENKRRGRRSRRSRDRRSSSDEENGDDGQEIDQIGSEDAMEEVPVRQSRPRRQYKIQEVIKRRQILLVQVVKEERGNKGAALTTYLSLAGRYSVLMPNTARGGGISRKITSAADRKRLKDVVRELEVPRGMGIILRTAGANRTKAEVKRDYEYLMRMWETVRTVTLSSVAPSLVYEEGSLIKRSIRDLYNKDIDQILVSGEGGYREAKDFMRMLMPSQAKVVQPYRETMPIFARQGIEAQLDKMVQPHVTLKSGGYIIINQTEALVAIDVNSGRSTKEHSIEDTAFQTNMEAAEEIARQLRLRDLAGLIVIDFIDMEEKRNNRTVEKKIKECLKSDRARIQVGSISHFGLLEMSRQRIRASVLESTMRPCPVCEGTGHIRSSSSLALHVLRSIEEHLQKHSTHDLLVKAPTATALYILNEKRRRIEELEQQYGLRIILEADESVGHHGLTIEHGAEATHAIAAPVEVASSPSVQAIDEMDRVADEEAERREKETLGLTDEDEETNEESSSEEDDDNGGKRRRRRRRRRRGENGSSDESSDNDSESEDETETETPDVAANAGDENSDDEDEGRGRRRRRRGRRGGRRGRDENSETTNDDAVHATATDADAAESVASAPEVADGETPSSPHGEPQPETIASATGSDMTATHAGADAIVTQEDSETVKPAQAPTEAFDTEPAAAEQRVSSSIEDDERAASVSEAQSDDASADTVSEVEVAAVSADDEREQPEQLDAITATAANDDHAEPAAGEPEAPREPVVTSTGDTTDEAQTKPRRTGWWARRSFF